jgi:uncharacterized protein involved in exopolysaccharide biosynthesis
VSASSERRRLEQELAALLVELGELQDELEASPAGPLARFRRRRLARRLASLERRIADLRARWAQLPPAPGP